jgi:hypothetical protein
MKRMAVVEEGTPELWGYIQQLIDGFIEDGYLNP